MQFFRPRVCGNERSLSCERHQNAPTPELALPWRPKSTIKMHKNNKSIPCELQPDRQERKQDSALMGLRDCARKFARAIFIQSRTSRYIVTRLEDRRRWWKRSCRKKRAHPCVWSRSRVRDLAVEKFGRKQDSFRSLSENLPLVSQRNTPPSGTRFT